MLLQLVLGDLVVVWVLIWCGVDFRLLIWDPRFDSVRNRREEGFQLSFTAFSFLWRFQYLYFLLSSFSFFWLSTVPSDLVSLFSPIYHAWSSLSPFWSSRILSGILGFRYPNMYYLRPKPPGPGDFSNAKTNITKYP